MKTKERDTARRLRSEQGLPIKEISRLVGVSVSSVNLWVRDVPLSPEQEAALDPRNPVRNGQRLGTINNSARCRAVREEAQQHGRALARRRDPQFIAGCMLYWAEGSKCRNAAQIVNADVELIRTFLKSLRSSYDVPDERIALSINCFLGNGLSIDEIQQWWLAHLELPVGCLRRPVVNVVSSASKRRKGHTLPYGTARLTVHSTFIVQSIYGAIQEFAGIDRPEWLDL